MTRATQNVATINELPVDDRLKIYDFLTNACTHLYSKNELQADKFNQITPYFVKLAKEDPYFLAHLTAWALKKDSKDLKTLAVYFNFLNDANGEPFFAGSKKNKPNLRLVSASLLQELPPHLSLRVLELSRQKFEVAGFLSNGAHYPSIMKTAFRKYMLYREANPDMIKGAKNNAMGKKLIRMYKLLHIAPTLEAASILNWKQKGREIKAITINFDKMSAKKIAEEIEAKGYSPLIALSAIPQEKMNHLVAKALLKNCTGNQAIILHNMFRTKGFLEVPEIKEIFEKKIKTATTAVDRIDTLTKDLTGEEKKTMSKVRADVRKDQMGDLGKIFMHIDKSSSMSGAIEFAKKRASVIAECVKNPEVNFAWGLFGQSSKVLKNPSEFTREEFEAALYGVRASDGATDCIGLYEAARKFGAEIDIYVTDQGHNVGNIGVRVKQIHERNPEYVKPKAVVIVHFSGWHDNTLSKEMEALGIPVTILKPEAITESALVAQAVKTAVMGRTAIIDEIMDTPLPNLPRWYNDNTLEEDYQERLKSDK